MAKKQAKSNNFYITEAAPATEREFKKHLEDLGLASADQYRQWCKQNGFRAVTHKDWQDRRHEKQTMERLRATETLRRDQERHYQSLGFRDGETYYAWCAQRGFTQSQRKSADQCEQEREALKREKAQAAMQSGNRFLRKPEEAIQTIFRGEFKPDGERAPVLLLVWQAAQSLAGPAKKNERECLLRLLLRVQQRGDLLRDDPVIAHLGPNENNTYIGALTALACHYTQWIRPLDAWKPDSHSAGKQFASLARHLLAKYAVPAFLDSVWFAGQDEWARRQQGWHVHIGAGKNIRTADLPLKLSEKAAHHVQFAPANFSAFGGLRWGQLRALNAAPNLIRAVVATPLGENFEQEEFWVSVLHFFVNDPMLDAAHIGPIVDYIRHRKFVPQVIAQPDGTLLAEPPEPNFSMKGRTPEALLRRVEEWHRTLIHEQKVVAKQWGPAPLNPLFYKEPPERGGVPLEWSIHELRTTSELSAEGRAMSHCVGTYVASCLSGSLSVWSLRLKEGAGLPRRVMTIAVSHSKRSIIEARGKCNKLPGDRKAPPRLDAAPRILKLWMDAQALTNSAYMG